MGHRAGLDGCGKSHPQRDLITILSSQQRVARPITPSRSAKNFSSLVKRVQSTILPDTVAQERFNPSNSKLNLNYITRLRCYCTLNKLPIFGREITVVSRENHTKHINTMSGHNVKFLGVTNLMAYIRVHGTSQGYGKDFEKCSFQCRCHAIYTSTVYNKCYYIFKHRYLQLLFDSWLSPPTTTPSTQT